MERSARMAPGRILAEGLVAEVPGALLTEPAELPVDLPRTDALTGEGVTQLLDGCRELPEVLADRLDQRPGGGTHELHVRCLRSLEEPSLELLALDLDLPHLTDGGDQLLQRRRHLAALGHRAGEDERGVGVGQGEVGGQLGDRLLREIPAVAHEEGPALTEQRRRGQVLQLPALPRPGVDLVGTDSGEQLEGGLTQEERVLAPQQDHGRGGLLRHRSDATTGLGPRWSRSLRRSERLATASEPRGSRPISLQNANEWKGSPGC